MSPLALILRNVLRNRRRTFLTVTSLAISLCILGSVMALSEALFSNGDATAPGAQRLVVHNRISLTQDLPIAYEKRVAEIPGVSAVTSLRWFGGTYKDARNRFAQFAVEPQTLFRVYPELVIAPTQFQAFVTQRTASVASRALAAKQGWKVGDRIPLVGTMTATTLDLTLVGIFDDPAGGESLFFNREYLRESMPVGAESRDMVQQYYVETESRSDVPRVGQAIDATFAGSAYPTQSESEQAFLLRFLSFVGNLKLFLVSIAAAVSFMILLVSANMLSMSVRERTTEIGILKTLGFSSGEILRLVAGEASLIALTGGLAGCAAAAGLCAAVGVAMKGAPSYMAVIKGIHVSPFTFTVTLAVALVIGLAGSLAPGVGAARTSIITALRYSE